MSKPTAPKPTAPAGGSAWRYYASTEVLGAEGAAGLVGIFAPSSKPGEVIDPELLEAESKEAKARKFGGGGLSWDVPGVPPPDFFIESDEPGTLCRAQLSVFSKGIKESAFSRVQRCLPWPRWARLKAAEASCKG
ncbi:unnamed protein product [Durusdinium trenchii]|uniref:Uncharacterized protein n=2 Tax=Durusdinium trenchii TaxID=1381693 RepID=A0ABP0LZJ8_9DINO